MNGADQNVIRSCRSRRVGGRIGRRDLSGTASSDRNGQNQQTSQAERTHVIDPNKWN